MVIKPFLHHSLSADSQERDRDSPQPRFCCVSDQTRPPPRCGVRTDCSLLRGGLYLLLLSSTLSASQLAVNFSHNVGGGIFSYTCFATEGSSLKAESEFQE